MTIDRTAHSRRAILATAAGGAASLAVGALGRPLAARAAAGDPILAGSANSAASETTLTATTGTAADVVALNTIGAGQGSGVTGLSPRGAGVLGVSGDTSAGPYSGNDMGVSGRAAGPHAFAGVAGDSDSGYGVIGTSGGAGVLGAGAVVGVLANSFDLTGTSLYAVSSIYPLPAPAANTAAHVRRSVSAPGQALFVDGRMKLKWSGRVSLSAGATSKKIAVAGMTSSTMIFAMLQSNKPGVSVRACVASAGAVTFYLSKALPSSAVVAWMAVG
jgi:hypothetical protein